MVQAAQRRGFSRRVPGLGPLEYGDLLSGVAAAGLTLFVIALAGGLSSTGHRHGVVEAVAAIPMVLPVLFARRAPKAAAITAGLAALGNAVVLPHVVRCGAALPAAFIVAFAVGRRLRARLAVAVGLGFVAVDIVAQSLSDPKLGAGAAPFLLALAAGFWLIGWVVAGHSATAAALEQTNAELADRREATARLAVEADRERIASDVEGVLHQRIDRIEALAEAGRGAVQSEPGQAFDAFVAIQETGRSALGHLRGVVGNLRDEAPTAPQPRLDDLGGILARMPVTDARLTVLGDPRSLPVGIELSAVRIVEHLVAALASDPSARVDVVVRFRPDALELNVSGPARDAGRAADEVSAASERAAVHGGSVQVQTRRGVREALVRLPLAAGEA